MAVITSAAALTPAQIYQLALNTGFDSTRAALVTAIALRESAGYPGAYNGAGPDNSYGLMQINMIGSMGQQRLQQFGITDPKQLLDPATNMKAAYTLWGGNDSNFNTAWAVNYGGQYTSAILNNLPAVEAAAQQVSGTAPDVNSLLASLGVNASANPTRARTVAPRPAPGKPTPPKPV